MPEQKTLKCPSCTSTSLAAENTANASLAIFHCQGCQGHWVTSELTDTMITLPEQWDGFFNASLRSYNKVCPSCGVNLHESCFPNTSVLSDGCKNCHGFWFDAGEYEEVSTRLNAGSAFPGSATQSTMKAPANSDARLSSNTTSEHTRADASDSLESLFEHAVSFSIHQRKEFFEIISGIEFMNRYDVTIVAPRNKHGKIEEHSKSILNYLFAFFLGHIRPATLNFMTDDDVIMLRMQKFCRLYFDRLDITDASHRRLGSIRRKFNILRSNYIIQDKRGRTLMNIKGPLFYLPFFDHTFKIIRRSHQVGEIRKKYAGFLQEAFTDADKFECRIERSLPPRDKILIFCATILIDFGSFENNESVDFSF